MKKFVMKWWPIFIVGVTSLSSLAPVFSNNLWAVLPSIAAAGIMAYAAQVCWEYNGRRYHWAQGIILMGFLQYGQLLNALWLERVDQAKVSALLLGMFLLTICGMGAAALRGKSAQRDADEL